MLTIDETGINELESLIFEENHDHQDNSPGAGCQLSLPSFEDFMPTAIVGQIAADEMA